LKQLLISFDIKRGAGMSDLLIRHITPQLKQRLALLAHKNHRSLSDEAKMAIERGLALTDSRQPPVSRQAFGSYLFSLLEDEYRSDDLVFSVDDFPTAPDLE
jgi:plasmid stability protein